MGSILWAKVKFRGSSWSNAPRPKARAILVSDETLARTKPVLPTTEVVLEDSKIKRRHKLEVQDSGRTLLQETHVSIDPLEQQYQFYYLRLRRRGPLQGALPKGAPFRPLRRHKGFVVDYTDFSNGTMGHLEQEPWAVRPRQVFGRFPSRTYGRPGRTAHVPAHIIQSKRYCASSLACRKHSCRPILSWVLGLLITKDTVVLLKFIYLHCR